MKKILAVIAMFAVCGAAMAQSPAVSGDVDGDGVCTTNDVTVLYNYLLYDDSSAMVAGDQDGDGYITVGDVTWVYNVLLYVSHDDDHDYIDLGLPSGTQWATMNVGASSPEDYGDYFAWGETEPKDVYDWSTYKWCMGSNTTMTKYCTNSSYGYNGFVDNKTELDPEDDAATAAWGAEWRMPSLEQMQELMDNCTSEWTTRNGVSGRLFTSNINGASVFLPAAGIRWDGSLYNAGTFGYYWSRTLDSSDPYNAYFLHFYSGGVYWNYDLSRTDGQSVRAVRVQKEQEHEYVDLGLPSGTQWATMNVGASSPEDYGDYFAWGETEPKDVYDWSTYKWCEGSYDTMTKYCIYGWEDYGYNGFFDDKFGLDPEDDAASANWGPEWRTPSRGQIEELLDNCTTEWTTRNGVNGRLFTSNINGASLFLPAAGDRSNGDLNDDGNGNYWTLELGTSGADVGCFLGFSRSRMGCYNHNRCNGLTIRAVRVQQEPEHEYVDLGLPSGTQWATMNVGASSPEDYGDYFAWGETTPKDVYDWSTYKWCNGDYNQLTKYCTNSFYGYNGFVDNKTELDPEDDAATAAWGAEWRMPSKDQMEELYNNCTSEWTTRNGVNGFLFTSNINGASLFLPAAGNRWGSELYFAGSNGGYWSRTLYSGGPDDAYGLYFSSGDVDWDVVWGRDGGQSVRAVRVP